MQGAAGGKDLKPGAVSGGGEEVGTKSHTDTNDLNLPQRPSPVVNSNGTLIVSVSSQMANRNVAFVESGGSA